MARGEQVSVTQRRTRTGRSRQHQVAELAINRSEALKLRAEGWTIRKIAAHFDRHPSTICDWLTAEMAAIVTPHAEELRKLEGERLDIATEVVMQTIIDNAGNELALKAVDRLVRLSARRSEVFGIDAPVKLDIGNRAVDAAELELQKMLDEANTAVEQQRAALRAGETSSPLPAVPDHPPAG